METSTNPTRKLPEVRKALKEQQLARLGAKAKVAEGKITIEEYSKMYASQPEQLTKAEEASSKRAAVKAVKQAMSDSALNTAKGNASSFGGNV